ncbi:MAG: hypothetical protein AB8H80_13020 [Planctomycetota bacterium]
MSDSKLSCSQPSDSKRVDSRGPDSSRSAAALGLSPGAAAAASGGRQLPTAASSSDGYLSSGQSPGAVSGGGSGPHGDDTPARLHLFGPGQVGRAFLRQLAQRADRDAFRLVAVSDRSGTAYDVDGFDPLVLLAHKEGGGAALELPRAEAIPTELAIQLVAADVVVDATPSDAEQTEAAVRRGQAALQCGAALALCSKNGLSRSACRWLAAGTRARIGCNAVLGGTGAQLVAELDELRRDCRGLAIVGNVTTTAIVTAIEAGATLAEGIAEAERLGFLEPSARLDLDGSDAATKLLCVFGAVFGESWVRTPSLESVLREHVSELDPATLRERAERCATTRLVARATRPGAGGKLTVRFEELPTGSPLAAPADRVVYGYELASGLRVHTGLGVGYERTAEALWRDVAAQIASGASQAAGREVTQ